MVSAADYFVNYVFFLHRITLLATGDGLLSAAADFRPAGNILSILPARAKLFSEAWLILSKNLVNQCVASMTLAATVY